MIKRNGYDFVLTSLSASDFFPTFTLCVSLKQTYRLLRSAATHATGCRRRATQYSWWGAGGRRGSSGNNRAQTATCEICCEPGTNHNESHSEDRYASTPPQ